VPSQTAKVTVDSGLCLISYPQILDLAYPPPDHEIRNHLDWQARNLHEGKTHYLHLLGHLFRVASDELDKMVQKMSSYVALAHAWRLHLEESGNRSRIYRMAVEKCTPDDLVRVSFVFSF
jgi:hypothetical protein